MMNHHIFPLGSPHPLDTLYHFGRRSSLSKLNQRRSDIVRVTRRPVERNGILTGAEARMSVAVVRKVSCKIKVCISRRTRWMEVGVVRAALQALHFNIWQKRYNYFQRGRMQDCFFGERRDN